MTMTITLNSEQVKSLRQAQSAIADFLRQTPLAPSRRRPLLEVAAVLTELCQLLPNHPEPA
ncbi:MAG: hypothetical protein HY335_10115 [Deinococcus sp.]|nr:hypothetical protein [Deinococcus sp.]